MKLRLKYEAEAILPVKGAFLRGNAPEKWLEEMDRWGLDPEDLTCFAVPAGLDNPAVSGLFVCFGAKVQTEKLEVLQAYRRIGTKLYVPCQASLSPALTSSELAEAFVWETQVFHPSIGLIGFGPEDAVDLAALLLEGPEVRDNWECAHAGLPGNARLNSIVVTQPPLTEVLKDAGGEIGGKELKDIPGGKGAKGGDGESNVEKSIRDLQKGFLKGAMRWTKKLNEALSGSEKEVRSSNPDGKKVSGGNWSGGGSLASGGLDLLDRFQNWMGRHLDNLEEKRNSEIDRLMDLFANDPNEALKYALPINDPYAGRGTAQSSSSLGRRTTDFNLGSLGGGQARDNWDLSSRYAELRQAYLAAAQREVDARNFRKAAYIYAHLLGDFNSAANVLEQGGHFREAAELYKEHLKNAHAAAECLEKGGLLLEAIALYLELGKREKAADLYKTLGQNDRADLLYQKCVQAAQDNGNYLEAARIYQHKMELPELALQAYLDGWESSTQAPACLAKYFEMYFFLEKPAPANRLEELAAGCQDPKRSRVLMNNLPLLFKSHADDDFRAVSREIFITRASAAAETGNFQYLNRLKEFVSDDRLLHRDVSRFLTQRRKRPASVPRSEAVALSSQIKWINGLRFRGQLLAIGLEGERLHLARVNARGQVVHYSWPEKIDPLRKLSLRAFEHSDQLLLVSNLALYLRDLDLPVMPGFDTHLQVHCPKPGSVVMPIWLIQENGNYLVFGRAGDKFVMLVYDKDRNLLSNKDCTVESQPSTIEFPMVSSRVVSRGERHYMCAKNYFLRIGEDGDIHYTQTADPGILVSVSQDFPRQYAIASTDSVTLIYPEAFMSRKVHEHTLKFYAPHSEIVDIRFAGPKLVVLHGTVLDVYIIEDDMPEPVKNFSLPDEPACLMDGSTRDEVAVLFRDGKIGNYNILPS